MSRKVRYRTAAWEDNDKKHEQNREVCTHGVTLLDREQLIPAEVAPLPLPELVRRELVPGLEAFLEQLRTTFLIRLFLR